MTIIKTNWLTEFYDPLAPAPEPKESLDSRHHLVYAAMLDGLRGKEAISDYSSIGAMQVNVMLQDLADAGYVRIGRHNSRPCYVLWEDPNTYYAPALTPDQVQEIGVLASTRGYTHHELAKHYNVKPWVISDAMQGRKQYRESRV